MSQPLGPWPFYIDPASSDAETVLTSPDWPECHGSGPDVISAALDAADSIEAAGLYRLGVGELLPDPSQGASGAVWVDPTPYFAGKVALQRYLAEAGRGAKAKLAARLDGNRTLVNRAARLSGGKAISTDQLTRVLRAAGLTARLDVA